MSTLYASPPYAELHCRTNFSFLEGASHADELVRQAIQEGYHALAITDRATLSGVVRAHSAAKSTGLKLLLGAEVPLRDAPTVVLWVTDRRAYGRLARLLTVGRRRSLKGACDLEFADVAEHAAGLLAGVLLPPDLVPQTSPRACESFEASLGAYREVFGDRLYLLLECHREPGDYLRQAQAQTLGDTSQVPLLAAADVHYHHPQRQVLHEVLTAIRLGTTVADLQARRFINAERHLRSRDALARLYAEIPEALARTVEVADRCHFSLDELRYEYPEELAPEGKVPLEYLKELAWQGAHWRYPAGIPAKVSQSLDHELRLIEELHYEAYFLTVWDLVHFARGRGILCQGRGSAANSAVCYCLGVTSVDPAATDLLFERFISRERNEAPDIDVDFEHERREEVLQYIYDKYGRDRAGMTAEVITYRLRSAIRDVGKALGFSLDRVDRLAKQVEGHARDDRLAARFTQAGLDPDSPSGRRYLEVVEMLVGFPRHLSQHVGGMVITRGPLCELATLENAAMPGRTVLGWDKNDLDELGILKVDCLALGMLTAIRKAFQLITSHTAARWTLANIPQEDPRVYDAICAADTLGVFQIESRAQMSMLPRLRPRTYYDLVIEVAIVRPGPIQGQMVHPYLRRRAGREAIVYANEAIRGVLEKTLGIPIFQEQAMRLAVVAAGFTPGEADQLRRAMGAWRKTGVIEQFRQKMMQGMRRNGLDEQFAAQVFQQIRGFGEYGFPESHAASFALLVYVSAWLKHHYPAFFCAAMLNSQPLGFYAPAQLIGDARKHQVPIRPIDVNRSEWDCTLEPVGIDVADRAHPVGVSENTGSTVNPRFPPPDGFAVRLGFRLIQGASRRDADVIVARRRSGPYRDIHDFATRTALPSSVITRLADGDVFHALGGERRQQLWQALAESTLADETRGLFADLPWVPEPTPELPGLDPLAEILRDYATTGVSLRGHPLQFYRERLAEKKVLAAEELGPDRDQCRVEVAGIVLLRQRPSTAKGITFVTLEDETGTVNLILHQTTWDKYHRVARNAPAWVARGRLEAREQVVHVIVERLFDFGEFLRGPSQPLTLPRSRDFR